MKPYELIVLTIIIAPQVIVLGGSIVVGLCVNSPNSSNNSEES